MKSMKRVSVLLIALVALLFTSCGKGKPETVAKSYIDCLMNGDFVKAYEYIAESDKDSLNYDMFINGYMDEIGDFSIIIDYFMDHTSYKITGSTIDGDTAVVDYEVTTIDAMDETFGEAYLGAIFSCLGMDDEKEIALKIKDALEEIEAPLATNTQSLDLVMEDGNWKVLLD